MPPMGTPYPAARGSAAGNPPTAHPSGYRSHSEEDGIGVALPHPLGHLEGDVFAQALFVIVPVDHLVVEIIFGEAATVTPADVQRPVSERLPQFVVRRRLEPILHPVGDAPKDIVSAQRKVVLVSPGQDGVNRFVIYVALPGFHSVPFQGILGHRRVEVGKKEAEILLPILRAHASIKCLAGQGGAKPKLMPLLFDHHFCPGRRLDDQDALAVLVDGRVQVLRWFLRGCRRHGAQEDNAELKTPQVAQIMA